MSYIRHSSAFTRRATHPTIVLRKDKFLHMLSNQRFRRFLQRQHRRLVLRGNRLGLWARGVDVRADVEGRGYARVVCE